MTTSTTEQDWRHRAACRDAHLALFYSPSGDSEPPTARARRENAALAVCHRCPVISECLEWAISSRDAHAVLGGTTPEDRQRIVYGRRAVPGIL